ncbi:hypothetical protein BH20ACT9_BH20ACT9_13030 [soil metagenome]
MTPLPRVLFGRALTVVATALLLAACGGGPSTPSVSPTRKPTQQASQPRRHASAREPRGDAHASHRKPRRDEPSSHQGSSRPDGDTDTAAGADMVRVTVRGKRVKGPDEVRAPLGERVRIEVRADTSDHVHVHGYDVSADVAPGRPARLRFEADIPGAFEVELEDAQLPLFELVVR